MPSLYFTKNRWSNWFLGSFLLSAMFMMNLAVGWILFGEMGAWFAGGLLLYSLWTFPSVASKAVMRSYGAREISLYEAPELWRLFQRLTEAAGIRHVVELYYLPSSVPNAFAFGTDSNAAICVSDGLLRMMAPRELAGILAHELAHIRNRDTSFMSLALAIRRVNGLLARFGLIVIFFGLPTWVMLGGSLHYVLAGLLLLLTPLLALLLQLALSRTREFNADLTAAEITRDPMGLAAALHKVESIVERGSWWQRGLDPRRIAREPTWLRTHPETAERIRRLQQIHQRLPENTQPLLSSEPVSISRRNSTHRPSLLQVLFGSWG
ncbi:MAG: M48 family metalloprotease [Pirellulaceae bacterium]|nr:M48 family metalloprotease [Pirellulaceae bacterium]